MTIIAGLVALGLMTRAVRDGRAMDAVLCLVLALASAVLWGVEP